MNDLMRQSMGSFHKDGQNRYIDDFLKPDAAISPRYRYDSKQAEKLMEIRPDSKGSPIRRTFLGTLSQYKAAVEHNKVKTE